MRHTACSLWCRTSAPNASASVHCCWTGENTLLYALAGHVQASDSARLATSEFGLWFTHKGIPSFGESSETQQVGQLMSRIDSHLQRARSDEPAQRLAVLPAIREDLAAIRTLMTLLFERIGELDAGSDALTNLLNRRFPPTVLRRRSSWPRATARRSRCCCSTWIISRRSTMATATMPATAHCSTWPACSAS